MSVRILCFLFSIDWRSPNCSESSWQESGVAFNLRAPGSAECQREEHGEQKVDEAGARYKRGDPTLRPQHEGGMVMLVGGSKRIGDQHHPEAKDEISDKWADTFGQPTTRPAIFRKCIPSPTADDLDVQCT